MSYKVLGMLRDGGLGKDMHSGVAVKYLSAMDRIEYLVSVQNRELRWCFSPLDTSDDPGGQYIYVMDGDGNIYTASKRTVVHHSAFLAGQPAAAAGHWTVKNGVIVDMDAQSGHYQPTADYCQQIITELEKRGVPTRGITTNFGSTSKQCMVGFKRMHGITGLKWYETERGGVVKTDYAEGVTDASGNRVAIGTHIQGQRLRLYPGFKPKWTWY